MNKRLALVAALLATTMAVSPAWSQGAGGGGGSGGSGGATSGSGSSQDPGGVDSGSSNRGGATGNRDDNSGRGPSQPGNRSANEPTNSQNQSPIAPNVERPTTPQAGQPIAPANPSAQVPAQRPAAPTAQAPAATAPGRSASLDINGLHEAGKDHQNLTYNGLTAKNLEDMNIVDASGKKVGEIDKVLLSKDNKVVAVVVDAGGFLGMGGDQVIVGLDQLTLDSQKKQFVASMNENQIKALPKWDDKARNAAPSSTTR